MDNRPEAPTTQKSRQVEMDSSYSIDVELALALMMAEETASGNHHHQHGTAVGGGRRSVDHLIDAECNVATDLDVALALSLQQEEDEQAAATNRTTYSASAGSGFGHQATKTPQQQQQAGQNGVADHPQKQPPPQYQQYQYQQQSKWEEEEQLAIAMSMQDANYEGFSNNETHTPSSANQLPWLQQGESEQKQAAAAALSASSLFGCEAAATAQRQQQQNGFIDQQQQYQQQSKWEEEEQLAIALSMQDTKYEPFGNNEMQTDSGAKQALSVHQEEDEQKQAATTTAADSAGTKFGYEKTAPPPQQEEEKKNGFIDQQQQYQQYQQQSKWEEEEQLAIAMSMQDTKYEPFGNNEMQTNSGTTKEPWQSDIDQQIALARQRSSFIFAGRESLLGEHVLDSHDDYQIALEQARRDTEAATDSSITGKAWNFVRAVIEEHESIMISQEANKGNANSLMMETIGVDDMMYTVEHLIATRAVFLTESIPGLESEKDTRIDIGYHYTRSDNLEYIKANGLLTKAERDQRGVATNYNGSVFGDGVYTGNDPFAFCNYGDTGLLVARLKGAIAPACRGGHGFVGDTAIATKGGQHQMVILRQSSQCVPLLRFQRLETPDADMDNAIWYAHRRLQGIVDRFFNDGANTEVWAVPRHPAVVARAPVAASVLTPPSPPPTPRFAKMPPSLLTKPKNNGTPDWYQDYKTKQRKNWSSAAETKKPVTDSPCESETFRRASDSEAYNNLHSEAMRVMRYSKEKVMCENMDTLVVVYAFKREPNDAEEKDNDKDYALIHRVEYHPDTSENRALIERLKHAFCNGILDLRTWSMFPHRTSPYLSYKNHAIECADALQELGVSTQVTGENDSSANVAVGAMTVTPESSEPTPANSCNSSIAVDVDIAEDDGQVEAMDPPGMVTSTE